MRKTIRNARKEQNSLMAQQKMTYKTAIEAVEMAYAFLNCDFITKPEVTIFNKAYSGNTDRPGFIVGSNIYAASYTGDDIPEYKDLFACAAENDYLMSCVASFDQADTDRVNMSVLPQEDGRIAILFNRPFADENGDSSKLDELIAFLEAYEV